MSKTKTIRKPVVREVTDRSLIGLTTPACYSSYYKTRLRKRVMSTKGVLWIQNEILMDDGLWHELPGRMDKESETIILLMMKEIQKLKEGSNER